MGNDFSFRSFLAKLLVHPSKAFIDGGIEGGMRSFDKPRNYFALLEDWKGRHYPLPMASRWVQWIYKKLKPRITRIRGVNFFFICPECETKSFYSLRNSWCRGCNTTFDDYLQPFQWEPYSSDHTGNNTSIIRQVTTEQSRLEEFEIQ